MDQIVVPQFLDVEDKIIGPITVRQFIEMLVAGLLIFIFYKVFDFSLFLVASLAVGGATLVVAFVRVNGQPFHYFLLNFLTTIKNPKLKVWRKNFSLKDIKAMMKAGVEVKVNYQPVIQKTVTSSRLSELSLVVDTGGVYQGEENI